MTRKDVTTQSGAQERRATHRANAEWQAACDDNDMPSLINLGVGESDGEWHDRFLIRSDEHMPHAVFIACGTSLQSDWDMNRLGNTVEDTVPIALCGRFAEGCQQSIEDGCPVPIEGSYRDDEDREILFRCIVMPVRPINDAVEFVYGAYSQKIAA